MRGIIHLAQLPQPFALLKDVAVRHRLQGLTCDGSVKGAGTVCVVAAPQQAGVHLSKQGPGILPQVGTGQQWWRNVVYYQIPLLSCAQQVSPALHCSLKCKDCSML